MRRGYNRAFSVLPHWAFFKRPIATYFPLFAVKAAALRFNAKAIAIAAFKLERFEPTLGLVPFGVFYICVYTARL